MDDRTVQNLLLRASRGDIAALMSLAGSPLSNLFFVRLAALADTNPLALFVAEVKGCDVASICAMVRAAALEITRLLARQEVKPLIDLLLQRGYGHSIISALTTEETVRDEQSCLLIASIAATTPGYASDCMKRLGAHGWRIAPPSAKRMLLQAAFTLAVSAVHGASAVWDALDDVHRSQAASMAQDNPRLAAEMMQRIGAAGMRLLPQAQQRQLLYATMADPTQVSIACGGVWDALSPHDRDAAVRCVCSDPLAAADLVERLGVAQWTSMDDVQRRLLLAAMLGHPSAAACGGGAVWLSLERPNRDKIDLAAAQSPASAAKLVIRSVKAMQDANECSPDRLPRASLAAMLVAAARETTATIAGIIAAWPLLSDEERQFAVNAVMQSMAPSAYAAILVKGVAHHWEKTEPTLRQTLVQAISRSDLHAAAGGFVWNHLTDDERIAIARAAGINAGALISIIGADAWKTLPTGARDALMSHLTCGSSGLATGVARIWRAMDDNERMLLVETISESAAQAAFFIEKMVRSGWDEMTPDMQEMLMRGAMQDPEEAARALIVLRDVVDDMWRDRLKRAVLGDERFLTPRPHRTRQ